MSAFDIINSIIYYPLLRDIEELLDEVDLDEEELLEEFKDLEDELLLDELNLEELLLEELLLKVGLFDLVVDLEDVLGLLVRVVLLVEGVVLLAELSDLEDGFVDLTLLLVLLLDLTV